MDFNIKPVMTVDEEKIAEHKLVLPLMASAQKIGSQIKFLILILLICLILHLSDYNIFGVSLEEFHQEGLVLAPFI